MKHHRLIDERSLAFDRLTAAKVAANPELVARARATLQRWLGSCSPRVRPVLLEWQAVLDGPLDELLALLTATDERATRLRQSSPFAGILTPAERTAILKEFHQRDSTAT
ncbi:MAG: hypothetical protein RMK20_12750 [Verrucomicrobiales bacterium]|nr:hypothetical protein [Verrucomicrobiales bacterium]